MQLKLVLTREFITKTHALEKKQGQLSEKVLEQKQACTDNFYSFLLRYLQIKSRTATQWHLLEFGIQNPLDNSSKILLY